ncbi:MAG: hypothetical protein HY578_06715 [Nitrospinae bacterium]|nr:hypothetical protein [Nitrospinota bacterium]
MKILFIKSTSLQHLALSFEKVMEAIKSYKFEVLSLKGNTFPQNSILNTQDLTIDVLAHSHVTDSLKGFGFIDKIIKYNSLSNFSPINIFRGYFRDIRRERYDMVVVPFNNISGAGYENVMAMAVCTGAGNIATCNKMGEVKLITYKNALFKTIKGYLYYPLALLMTVVLFVVGITGVFFVLTLRRVR